MLSNFFTPCYRFTLSIGYSSMVKEKSFYLWRDRLVEVIDKLA